MVAGRNREEVFNVTLALLLHQHGIVNAPEQSLKEAVQGRRHVPDVRVDYRGLRTAIEGKVDDHADAAQAALEQAGERVEKGIAHIGIAVLYPRDLRGADIGELLERLGQSKLRIAVRSEAGDIGWQDGGVDDLANLLRRTYDQLVAEDVVSQAAEQLDAAVSQFAKIASSDQTFARRARAILGIGEPPTTEPPSDEEGEE